MAKKNKKQAKGFLNIHPKLTPQLFGSVIMLILMIVSVAGFVYVSGGNTPNTENQIPDNYELQQVPLKDGSLVWFAIKNKEQFVFQNITGFDERNDLRELSEKIKSQKEIVIYQDKDFKGFDAKYLIQKGLKGLKIETIESSEEPVCNAGNLILGYNTTLEGDCLQFTTTQETSYDDAENLVYFMVQ